MRVRFFLLTAWVAAALPLVAQKQTATVSFPNGDQLTGTVERSPGGELIFSNAFIEHLVLDETRVTVTPEPQPELAESEAEAPSEAAQAAAPSPEAQVAATQTPEPEPEEPVAEAQKAPPATVLEASGLKPFPQALEPLRKVATSLRDYVGSWIPDEWNGRFTFGFEIRRTTNEVTQVRARLRARRRWERLETSWEAFYEFRETFRPSNGTSSINRDEYGGSADLRYDLVDRLFARAEFSYERDGVRDIDHDIFQRYGVGFRLLDNEFFSFNLLPSVGSQYRETAAGEQEWTPLASIGNEMKLVIAENLRFEQEASIGVNPLEFNNYNYDFEASLILDIDEWVQAVLSYEAEFDNFLALDSRDEERILLSLGIPF